MLCVNKYTQKYIDGCRPMISSQIPAYKKLATAVRNRNDEKPPHAALESFEPMFFNNMVLILDALPENNHTVYGYVANAPYLPIFVSLSFTEGT